MTKFDIHQHITDQIVNALESGVKPWACPWDRASCGFTLPMNHSTGNHYNGINVLALWCSQMERGFTSSSWMTFKQARALGGSVRKGETGSKVVFYSPIERENDKGEKEIFPMARAFTVFNLDQIDGIERPAPVILSEFEANEAAEQIVKGSGARIIEEGNSAHYSLKNDHIKLPPRDRFADGDNFYATAFHEIGHWTGAKSRLDRTFGKKFGDAEYAFEELVAELTAAFLGAEVGITGEHLQHESYIAHWLEQLKGDKKFIFKAASAASKAHGFVMEQVEQSGQQSKAA